MPSPRPLDAVLLTHAHSDHVGFAEKARTDAGARVWIHQADAEAARTGKPGWKNETGFSSYLLRGAFWGDVPVAVPTGCHQDDPDHGDLLLHRRRSHRRARLPAGGAHAGPHPR